MRRPRFDPAVEASDIPVQGAATVLPTRREVNIHRRKKRILDSATRIISAEGIAACTMRRLAREAKLDVTTLYNYYGSKEQILEALRRSGARSIRRQIEELGERHPLDRIRAIVRVTLGVRESPTSLARPLNLALPRRRPGEGPAAAAAKEALAAEIERAIERKLLHPLLDLELFTSTILEAFHPWLELSAAGVVGAEEVRARVEYTLSLCLLAAATPGSRRRLEAELIECQRRLAAHLPETQVTRARHQPRERAAAVGARRD